MTLSDELLARAAKAGAHICDLCQSMHRTHGETAVRRILGVALTDQEAGHHFHGRGLRYPTGDRRLRILATEDFEEHFGAGLGQRHESEFVNTKQFLPRQLFLIAQEVFLVPGLNQFMRQRRRYGKPYPKTLLAARAQRQPDGQLLFVEHGLAPENSVRKHSRIG